MITMDEGSFHLKNGVKKQGENMNPEIPITYQVTHVYCSMFAAAESRISDQPMFL